MSSDEATEAPDGVAEESVAPEAEASSAEEETPTDPVSVEDLLVTLESVTAERDQHLNDLQRVSAEFANFRKQVDKRQADQSALAGARVAEALLPVLDACDAALQQGVEGVEPIATFLRRELERSGLETIADSASPFDPSRHEAAMSEPAEDDQAGPVVVEVLRTGYAWNGRVLRAAMVRVRG